MRMSCDDLLSLPVLVTSAAVHMLAAYIELMLPAQASGYFDCSLLLTIDSSYDLMPITFDAVRRLLRFCVVLNLRVLT